MEAFALPFFRTALIASLVLAGIHAYLGYHVVRRGVIFVDVLVADFAIGPSSYRTSRLKRVRFVLALTRREC